MHGNRTPDAVTKGLSVSVLEPRYQHLLTAVEVAHVRFATDNTARICGWCLELPTTLPNPRSKPPLKPHVLCDLTCRNDETSQRVHQQHPQTQESTQKVFRRFSGAPTITRILEGILKCSRPRKDPLLVRRSYNTEPVEKGTVIEGYNYGEKNVMCRSVRVGVRPRGCARAHGRFPGVPAREDRRSKVRDSSRRSWVLRFMRALRPRLVAWVVLVCVACLYASASWALI